MNSNPIDSSSRIFPETTVQPKTESRAQQQEPLVNPLPISDLAPPDKEKTFAAKSADVEVDLLKELDQLLNTQADKIERELEVLEKKKKKHELCEAFLEGKEWGGWGLELIETSNDTVKEGIEFLEHVLPHHHFLADLPSAIQSEKIGHLTTLGGAFLSALDSGLQGLAMIYRHKILNQSKAVLSAMRNEETKRTAPTAEEVEKTTKSIKEWEIEVALEEKALAEEMLSYKFTAASNILNLAALPFTYLSRESLKKFADAAATGLSGIATGIDLIGSGVELKKSVEDSKTIGQWREQYQNVHQNVADGAKELFEQRKARMEKEVERLMPQFRKDHPQETDKNLRKLIIDYVDHKQTIEQITNNALKQMIEKKHEVENRLINLKLRRSQVEFSVAAISLTVSATLAVLGLLSISFGGAGLLLLALSLGSTVTGLGLAGASYLQAYREKPNLTKTLSLKFQAKMAWAKIRSAISSYSHQAKEKKLLEIAKVLHPLHRSSLEGKTNSADYQKALETYKKAKDDFKESMGKVKIWTEKLQHFEEILHEKSWQDFSEQASLQDPAVFNTLEAFQEAFEACDLTLLSDETKALLTTQLGVNLTELQAQIRSNPEGIRTTLHEFFVLNDANLVAFMQKG